MNIHKDLTTKGLTKALITEFEGDTYSAIEHIQHMLKEVDKTAPQKPVKPFIRHNPTVDEAKEYVKKLELYEYENPSYKEAYKEYLNTKGVINAAMKEYFIHSMVNVPKEYREKIVNKAYEMADYGSDFYSVNDQIKSLSEIFD